MQDFRIGLDLGGTKLAGVITDANSKILASRMQLVSPNADAVIMAMKRMIGQLCTAVNVTSKDVSFVGVGVPALISNSGAIYSCTHIPSLAEIDLSFELNGLGTWKLGIDNDVNCAAISAIKAHGPSFFLVTIGTGLGGALVLDNRLVRGSRGFAGEIGHIIVQAGGRLCPCGKRGCAEAYSCGLALTKRVEEEFENGNLREFLNAQHPNQRPSPRDVLERSYLSPVAKDIHREFCFYIAVAVSGMLEIVDAEKILIGGGVSSSFDFFKDELVRAYHDVMAPNRMRQDIEFIRIENGPMAGALGASQLDSV